MLRRLRRASVFLRRAASGLQRNRRLDHVSFRTDLRVESGNRFRRTRIVSRCQLRACFLQRTLRTLQGRACGSQFTRRNTNFFRRLHSRLKMHDRRIRRVDG